VSRHVAKYRCNADLPIDYKSYIVVTSDGASCIGTTPSATISRLSAAERCAPMLHTLNELRCGGARNLYIFDFALSGVVI
jgi:hypothetical protein